MPVDKDPASSNNEGGSARPNAFDGSFGGGREGARSAEQTARQLDTDTPGSAHGVWDDEEESVSGSFAGCLRDLESRRDPAIFRQIPHDRLHVNDMFLIPHFQSFQAAATGQQQVFGDPGSTSAMASSTLNVAAESLTVEIKDEDRPGVADNRNFVLVATGLGQSEGLAVDTLRGTAYSADRSGHHLYAVDLGCGAEYVVASNLGDIGDVALDGNGTAYVTDYAGARLLAVNLSDGSKRQITSADGIFAYGVALGDRGTAYVTDWYNGKLFAVDLETNEKKTLTEGIGHAAGIALNGTGKAYIGQKDGDRNLYEVDLDTGAKRLLTTLVNASTTRVELDGAGKAYVADHVQGGLYEVDLANGAKRVVATGLGAANGLAVDSGNGHVYVSNQAGELWRLSQRALRTIGGVGKVTLPPPR
ncbi:hypothetical protein [Nocardia wallacei]|uniref:Vgb family protein n=1 Tax=Nocardia wallacei TaxID=480035 RepID=UPI0024542872|nr:hypothetical protein [Nocardia wallacei]